MMDNRPPLRSPYCDVRVSESVGDAGGGIALDGNREASRVGNEVFKEGKGR